MEAKILQSFIQSREAWEVGNELCDPKGDFSPEGDFIFDQIGEYYRTDPDAQFVDREILCSQIRRGVQHDKRAQRLVDIVNGLPGSVSDSNVVKELVGLRQLKLSNELAGLLTSGMGQADVIRGKMEKYLGLASQLDTADEAVEVWQETKVSDLLKDHFDEGKLIKLVPERLNKLCDGGAKRGHHVLVFAPTEMGKTLFVINLVAGFIHQKLRTLYIGNEDPAADIYMRYLSRISGLSKYDIAKEPKRAQELLDKRGYGLLTLAPLAPGNFGQINKLIDKHDPTVVILDQLRNLDVRSDGRTQQLEKAATEARNLAKSRSVLVISVTQAGDSASGKRVLSRGDVDSSNVGIPGQVDLMIGIGATAEEEMRNLRVLSFPKNKLSGRHEHFTVQIDPLTSKVLEESGG